MSVTSRRSWSPGSTGRRKRAASRPVEHDDIAGVDAVA